MGKSKLNSFCKPRNLFVTLSLLMVSILMIELSGFSGIFLHLNNSVDGQYISIIHSNTSQNNNNNNNNNNKYKYRAHKDWFDASRWPKQYCPYYENICVYNQKLRVFHKSQEFAFSADIDRPSKVFGDHMPNLKHSLPLYLNVLNATMWNEQQREYEKADCRYHTVTNHMLIQGYFQSMLGEWYTRVLAQLYRFYHTNQTFTIKPEIQLYLFVGDQTPLYTFHYLFMQPFSNYNVQHFSNLFERIGCNCFHRLIFCGFKRKYTAQTHTQFIYALDRMTLDDDAVSVAEKRENGRYAPNLLLYPKMIEFYNTWMNAQDINIERDVKRWKWNTLNTYLGLNDSDETLTDVDEWFFIGFYQRNYRRTWLQLETHILPQCNAKYNKYAIYCTAVNLEGHLLPRDVLIVHRSFDLLIGIHGAHLTDAVWMHDPDASDTRRKLKYVIELLPANGPSWTASLHTPTALGIIFWQSKLNHVGLKLLPQSITQKDWKRGESRWYKSDFVVDWNRLSDVIHYLIIDQGGFCEKYKYNARDIKLPLSFKQKDYKFAIYNAYCSGDSEPCNFVTPYTKGRALSKCQTCLPLMYDTE